MGNVINYLKSGGGTDISDTTAVASDVLAGKDFYLANGVKTTGTIPVDNIARIIIPDEQVKTINVGGKYVTQDITVDAIPSRYKDTTNANAVAGDILAGKVAVNGSGEVTGTIQTYSGETNITENGTLATSGKYLSSDISVNVSGGGDDELARNLIERNAFTEENPLIIPNGVTSIGESAFIDYVMLKSIILPDSVKEIKKYAFEGCTYLTSINIPSSVTSIGYGAFRDCTYLTSITIPELVTSIKDYTFYGCNSLPSINIPSSVTSIGNYAFRSCSKLPSINIPSSVTSIGESAFDSCTYLTSINIPDSVTSIGQYTFQFCKSLTSITIPSSVTSIGYGAFMFCVSLTSITIPDNVTKTGKNVFHHCIALAKVKYLGQVPNIDSNTFYNCTNIEVYDFRACTTIPTLYNVASLGHKANCQIVVPDALYDTWQTSTNWSSLTDVVWVKASDYVEA